MAGSWHGSRVVLGVYLRFFPLACELHSKHFQEVELGGVVIGSLHTKPLSEHFVRSHHPASDLVSLSWSTDRPGSHGKAAACQGRGPPRPSCCVWLTRWCSLVRRGLRGPWTGREAGAQARAELSNGCTSVLGESAWEKPSLPSYSGEEKGDATEPWLFLVGYPDQMRKHRKVFW